MITERQQILYNRAYKMAGLMVVEQVPLDMRKRYAFVMWSVLENLGFPPSATKKLYAHCFGIGEQVGAHTKK